MGNGNQKENLYNAINADNCALVTQILKASPELINDPVTTENETTPLGRAAWRGNVEMIYTLIELGADVNYVGPQNISPLQWAAQRGKDEAVDFLLQKNAKLDYISKDTLNALDYAVLFGAYNTARKLINLGLGLRDEQFYLAASKEKHIPYYDYKKMLDHLESQTPLEECPPFDIRPPEKKFNDPVIDPRETWTQFAKRIMEFDEAPLVERAALPEELRPENRLLGRLRSYVNGQSPFPKQTNQATIELNEPEPVKDEKHPEESVVLTSEEAKNEDEEDEKARKEFQDVLHLPNDDGADGGAHSSVRTKTSSDVTDVNQSTDVFIKGMKKVEPAQIQISTQKE